MLRVVGSEACVTYSYMDDIAVYKWTECRVNLYKMPNRVVKI